MTGLATQGYFFGSVTSYQIMYSVNGRQWSAYKDNSTTKSKVCARVDFVSKRFWYIQLLVFSLSIYVVVFAQKSI